MSLQIAKVQQGSLPQADFQKFVNEAKQVGVPSESIRDLLETQGVKIVEPPLPPEPIKPPGLTEQQILVINQKAAQKARELNHINYDEFFNFDEANAADVSTYDLHTAREKLAPEVGKQFDAHGIAKGADDLQNLVNLLNKGIDPNRPFYTMNLQGTSEENAAAAGGMGAAGPYDVGGFIVLSEPGGKINKSGIKGVLVNNQFYDALPELQSAYPNVRWIKSGEMSKQLSAWVHESPKP